MVEARRGLEVRHGPAGNVVLKLLLSSLDVLGVSCRAACERTATDTRRPLGSGQEAACAGFGVPCIRFQPISCRAPWRPAPPLAEQVCETGAFYFLLLRRN